MDKSNHDGFWSALAALGGQFVPPSLSAAVEEAKEEEKQQMKFDFDTKVEESELPAVEIAEEDSDAE